MTHRQRPSGRKVSKTLRVVRKQESEVMKPARTALKKMLKTAGVASPTMLNHQPGKNGKVRLRPSYITKAEIRAMMDATTKGTIGLRNRALITVLWQTGGRIAEVLALEPEHFMVVRNKQTQDDGTVVVRRIMKVWFAERKGGEKEGHQYIGEDAVTEVERWLQRRKECGLSRKFSYKPLDPKKPKGRRIKWQPVFATMQGQRVSDTYVRMMLARLAKKAGIQKRIHPHGFRHAYAVELREAGYDLTEIQQALGHKNVGTTARYLVNVPTAGLVNKLARRRMWADDDDA